MRRALFSYTKKTASIPEAVFLIFYSQGRFESTHEHIRF